MNIKYQLVLIVLENIKNLIFKFRVSIKVIDKFKLDKIEISLNEPLQQNKYYCIVSNKNNIKKILEILKNPSKTL